MKWLLMFLMVLGGISQALAQTASAPREERVQLPLTASQVAANAGLDEEIRRAKAAYPRRKAEVEQRVRQRQVELVDQAIRSELMPCTTRVAAMSKELDKLEAERRQQQGSRQARPEGGAAPMSEVDKRRAQLLWDLDPVRADCEALRRRLEAGRDQRVLEAVRVALAGELQKLEREQERLLTSLEQRRHRPQSAPRELVESRKRAEASPSPSTVAPSHGYEASFGCANAATSVEKAVCASAELAQLDWEVADAFRRQLATNAPQAQALRRRHQRWLDGRSKTCPGADIACLLNVYGERLATLTRQTGSSPLSREPIAEKPDSPAKAREAPARSEVRPRADEPAPEASSPPGTTSSPELAPTSPETAGASPAAAPGSPTSEPGKAERWALLRAVAAVTAMFQDAQDAVVGLVGETPVDKLRACSTGKRDCPSSVYTDLLPGMNRADVLKSIGPPVKTSKTDPDQWSYGLPSNDSPSAKGFTFTMRFQNDRVVEIRAVKLD
jgi:uncharacterized protein